MLQGDGAGDGDNEHNPGEPVIQYNIVFDDDAQQQDWFGLLRRLRSEYPDHETIGARLAAWIEASGPADGEG